MIKEVIFVGAEKRKSKKTGNDYWMAAFLDGMGTVEMFLTEEVQQQLMEVKNMERVKLNLEIKPNRDKQYQVSLVGVAK
jgi:hypothetical protein